MARIPTSAVILAILAVYARLHISGLSPTSYPLPWSNPRRPLLLHEFLLPQLLLFLSLALPLPAEVAAAIFLPPIAACLWALIGAGSRSPSMGYAAGTFVTVYVLKVLEIYLFRDGRGRFRRYSSCESEGGKKKEDGEAYPRDSSFGKRAGWVLEVMHTLRGVGWNWSCVPRRLRAPVTSRSKWILTRLLRGAAIWLWLDFLVFYVRTLDRNFFVPEGHATGFSPPADGVPYPSLFSISTKPLLSYPPPLGFPPMPPTPSWKRTAYQLLLHVLRTVLGASAMFTTISGMYTFVALVFVLLGCVLGTSAGWRARWLSPNAWPDAFGHILGGDYGHGVRGYWGRGWHSLFRSIFTAPGDGLVARLSLPPHSLAAKIIALTLPFVFSGALHFAGCWTQSLGGWGAVQFFLLQPLGIVLESYCCCFRPRPRGAVAKVLMYLWALAWFAATATPFFEDYRWGGLWVVEPIPVSVIRWRADLWMSQPGERGWGRWADGGGYGVVLG